MQRQQLAPTMQNLGFGDPFLQRANFSKSSHFKYRNGTRIMVDKRSSYDQASRPSSAQPRSANQPPAQPEPPLARPSSASAAASPISAWAAEPMPQKLVAQPEVLPAWVSLSQKVLRFSGYFMEVVPESQVESSRVRKVHIYYYLEDDSMQVSEPRVDNSGIQQGLIVRRHRIPHPSPDDPGRTRHGAEAPDGSVLRLKRTARRLPLTWSYRDLDVGVTVEFYRRKYMLTDADPFTREFYATTLASPLKLPTNTVPEDSYQQHRALHDRGEKPANRQRDAFTKYMESKMGVNATRSGDDPKKISKYITNAGRVLRFYGSWIDTAMHELVIHYYLCDDTVEVVEKFPANSGCDKQGSLLKRQQLPKNTVAVHHMPGGYANNTHAHRIVDRQPAVMLTDMNGEQLLKTLSDKLAQKISNIRPLFRKFDEDKNGVVSYAEFRHGLSMLGFEPTDEVFERLLALVDADASGAIDYNEFAGNLGMGDEAAGDEEDAAAMDADVVFVHWHDLRPGGTLDCFGKEITIYDADAFTKRFFLLNCNTSLTARQPPAVPHEPTPTLVVPPHDQGGGGHGVAAVGEPEDSLQNCLHLVAKAPRGPRQDLSRFMQYEGDILRFEAVMVSSEPTDSARRFIVSYYIRDFTIAVFEPPQRNSGIIGGKFLERTRVQNPSKNDSSGTASPPSPQPWNGSYRISMANPVYYEPGDLHIGAVLTVHHQDFHLFKCDLFTLNYMERNVAKFPSADPQLALDSLAAQMAEHGLGSDSVAAAVGADASGLVDVVMLKAGLGALGLRLNDQQVVSLARKYDTTGVGAFEPVAMLEQLEPAAARTTVKAAW